MNNEEIENKQLLEGNLRPAAARYLTIYLGEPTTGTWEEQIDKLYTQHERKQGDNIAEFMRNTISCAILMPLHDKVNTDEPENVLHKCPYWRQINERDWFSEMKEIAKQDLKIMGNRPKMLSLGVVEPIAYQQWTRQAYNWLYTRAEESGVVTDANKDQIKTRMSNLVHIYGGVVVCGAFNRDVEWVRKVTNWRTGYFFEKLIYKVFTEEEMYKVKKLELKKSSEKLVKSVRV